MYRYIDRPVAGLEDGPHFLIWAMRRWVESMHERRCPSCVIGPIFAKWRMMAGLAPFQAMMATLNRHGLRAICFAPACCGQVSEDEAMLLGLILDAPRRPAPDMAEALAMVVEPEQASALQRQMQTLAGAMNRAGILPGKAPRSADLP